MVKYITEKPISFSLESYKFPTTILDSSIFIIQCNRAIHTLQNDAFLAANIDSIVFTKDTVLAYLYVGQQLKFGKLRWEGLQEEWLEHPSLRNINLNGTLVDRENYKHIAENILTQLEENGYPLAKILLKDKRIKQDSLFARVVIEPGQLIVFGGIEQDNEDIIQTKFLEQYLGIQQGDAFKMSKINSIQRQISQLSYVKQKKNPEVRIINGKAYVKLFLSNSPSSKFDFLIGVLPNVENETQFTISGELTADFKNKLKRGEEMFLHFRQLKPETQRIDISMTYPYLFNLPFGIHGAFALYRNGKESRDLNSEVGIQYRSGRNQESRFFINYQSSRLIELDTAQILSSGKLPTSLDVSSNNLGLKFSLDHRDYKFNPRRGLFAELSILAGVRNIIQNNVITELENETTSFKQAYDSLDLSVFQSSASTTFEYFFPIKKSSTIKVANTSGLKWNQSQVFSNEYYRIGGSSILRGFDEESIRAQYFSVFTSEFRYLLSLNSYFSAFVDYGLTYNEFRVDKKWDQPLSFGVGLSFQTNAGIFGLDVAVGKELGNSFDFRNAKTHFGFISLF